MEKSLLTVYELEEKLGLGKTKIYELIKTEPEFRPIRIGQAIRFPANHINDWIERQVLEQSQAPGHGGTEVADRA